jgi:error-prone DNA polymerase
MSDGREVVEDYRSLQLSLRAHPLSFLRPEFDQQKIVRCADLARIKEGRRIEVAGIVLVRQRPGSTNVTFVTIEDETGIANLIIWQRRFEAQRRIIMSAAMLHVRGMVQREGDVIHVIAERLEDYTPMLGRIGDMPFPHRHSPADGANGGGPDPRERKLLQIKDDYSAPFRVDEPGPGIALKSRNFH